MINKFVLDASVIIKWIVPEAYSENAVCLFNNKIIDESIIWMSPSIVLTEIANALWKKARRQELLSLEAKNLYNSLKLQEILQIFPTDSLINHAFDITKNINHDAIYDCCYLGLALRENAIFITADNVFYKKAKAAGYEENVQFIINVN